MVTMTIMVVLASLILPSLGSDAPMRLFAATSILRSDVELAQVMTISAPDEPVVVRFDTANARYWLAFADAPDTPIERSDGDPYVVEFGTGDAAGAGGVAITLEEVADATLEFNEMGGVADLTSEPKITLSLDGRWTRLTIATTTGRVTEASG